MRTFMKITGFLLAAGWLGQGLCPAAQQDFGAAESSAAFLNLPGSARQSALAGAGAATGEILGGANPAALGRIRSSELQAAHGFWVQDIFYDQLAFGMPWDKSTGWKAELNYYNFGSIDKYSADAGNQPLAQGVVSPYALAAGLGVGQTVMKDLSLGAVLKWVHQNLVDAQSSAAALDLGMLYSPGIKNLQTGLVFSNLGGTLSGFSLPQKVHLGAAYSLYLAGEGRGQLLTTLEAALPTLNPENYDVIAGVEYYPEPAFVLRAGYQLNAEAGLGGLDGLSAGLGYTYRMISLALGFTSLGALGNAFQVTVGYGW